MKRKGKEKKIKSQNEINVQPEQHQKLSTMAEGPF